LLIDSDLDALILPLRDRLADMLALW